MKGFALSVIAVSAFGGLLMLISIHFDLDMLNWYIKNGYLK